MPSRGAASAAEGPFLEEDEGEELGEGEGVSADDGTILDDGYGYGGGEDEREEAAAERTPSERWWTRWEVEEAKDGRTCI